MVVGQEYESGMITYILKVGDIGFESNKIKGFVVSLDDISESVEFWSDDISNNNYTSTDLFSGALNTDLIIGGLGTMESAALLCKNYRGGGYTNWYLPSSSQLELISNIKYELQTLKEEIYLSSSEFDNGNYIGVDMTSLTLVNVEKSEPHFVRAVRDFELDISSKYVRMKFTDVYNADYSDIDYWNTFFNTEFVNYKVIRYDSYIEVVLYNSDEVFLTANLFKDNLSLISFDSDLICTVPLNCFYGTTNLLNVNLSICTFIDKDSFRGCSSLNVLLLPNILNIGISAFAFCTSLSTLEFLNLNFIGSSAFQGTGITSANLPSILGLGSGAFSNCQKLVSINLDSCIYCGNNVFANCIKLDEVRMNELKIISQGMFTDCVLLTAFIGSNITDIGSYAFYNCSSLVYIIGISNIINIGDYAFNGCSSLTTNPVPNVKFLGNYVFQSTNIHNFTFNKLESIGSYCFLMAGLISLTVPNLKLIPQDMVYGSSITTINAKSATSIGKNAFYNCSSLVTVNVPKVVDIYDTAFYGCSSLVTLNIPLCNYLQLTYPTLPIFKNCTLLNNIDVSLMLKYNNAGGRDATLNRLMTDRPTCVINYTAELSHKLNNIDTVYVEYVDNADALANGLKIGQFYRTGDIFKVVH